MSMQPIERNELLIEPETLERKLATENLLIFDATVIVNPAEGKLSAKETYLSGHIPGAAFLDHQLLADKQSPYQLMVPDAAILASALGDLGINPESEVVVYATTNMAWATRIWWLLRYAGFNNVRVLNGSLADWQAVGGALETEEHQYPVATFDIDLQPGWFVGKDDVLSAMQDETISTVNALPAQAHDNAHITGSSCQPFSLFLNGGSRLLPDDELKERLGEVSKGGRVFTYCGGGIAATVNAVVHKLVGNPNVSVYDGSMSEWTGEGLPTEKES
ncbi:MAG: thiosulfate/3-mercaptopyruvate sulfurtransferase [Candidatus Azotimanducaceae bacterium]|jgi:thiosulfate/3-mercaptopyruvate sulfurtransferase